MTNNIKFKYDAVNGIFDYEGDHELLQSTLLALTDSVKPLHSSADKTSPLNAELVKSEKAVEIHKSENSPENPKSKPKKKATGKKPKFNADLNLLNLGSFYDGHILKNNTECIVAFLNFLSKEVSLTEITADEVFTCFDQLKTKLKTPGVKKALDNAKNLSHVIDYDRGFTNIRLTTKGSNLYHHDILKRDGEASK